MLSWYKINGGKWVVTYQYNKYSPIEDLGIFDTKKECLAYVDKFIDNWG